MLGPKPRIELGLGRAWMGLVWFEIERLGWAPTMVFRLRGALGKTLLRGF